MKKIGKQPSVIDRRLAAKKESVDELLQERETLKLKAIATLLEEREMLTQQLRNNTKRLAELDYVVRDSALGASARVRSLRLPDNEIKSGLKQLLARKPLSVPSICQHLHIARSRFAAFERKHKGFLGKKGKGKLTVYFLKGANA